MLTMTMLLFLTDETIMDMVDKYKTDDPCPFLKHVEYFKKDGEITACSIGERWSELSKENGLKTYIKGDITVRGANYNNKECPYKGMFSLTGCPYKYIWETDKMMESLKHPCDTGVVNEDGSINIDTLVTFIKTNFKFSDEHKTFVLPKSTMDACLPEFTKRDSDQTTSLSWNLPDFSTVARFEWDDFYLNYTDLIVTNDDGSKQQAVSLDTFLQFYFRPDELYSRTLGGELPVKAN